MFNYTCMHQVCTKANLNIISGLCCFDRLAFGLEEVDLDNNQLTGSLPAELGLLKDLTHMDVRNNSALSFHGDDNATSSTSDPEQLLPCFLMFSEAVVPKTDGSNMGCPAIIRRPWQEAEQFCSGKGPSQLVRQRASQCLGAIRAGLDVMLLWVTGALVSRWLVPSSDHTAQSSCKYTRQFIDYQLLASCACKVCAYRINWHQLCSVFIPSLCSIRKTAFFTIHAVQGDQAPNLANAAEAQQTFEVDPTYYGYQGCQCLGVSSCPQH